jgi:hypothetical protein
MSYLHNSYSSAASNLNLGLTLTAALLIHEAVKHMIRMYIGDGHRTTMTYVLTAGFAILVAVFVQQLTVYVGMKLSLMKKPMLKRNNSNSNNSNRYNALPEM